MPTKDCSQEAIGIPREESVINDPYPELTLIINRFEAKRQQTTTEKERRILEPWRTDLI
jgi:hypothetical protein